MASSVVVTQCHRHYYLPGYYVEGATSLRFNYGSNLTTVYICLAPWIVHVYILAHLSFTSLPRASIRAF